IRSLRGENRPEKRKNIYSGKTYNSADAIAEVFKQRNSEPPRHSEEPSQKPASAMDRLRSMAGDSPRNQNAKSEIATGSVPGSHAFRGASAHSRFSYFVRMRRPAGREYRKFRHKQFEHAFEYYGCQFSKQ